MSPPKKKLLKRSRHYSFTLNNPTDETPLQLSGFHLEKCTYVVYGRETCPTTGTPHLQGHMYLTNPSTIVGVQKILKRMGIKMTVLPIRKSSTASIIYCKKGDDFTELGECPSQGKRNDLHTVMEHIAANPQDSTLTLMETYPTVVAKYPRFVQTYKLLKHVPEILTHSDDETPNLWVWGPPGVGKSRPFQEAGAYSKLPTKWWCGYDGQADVLIDDLEPDHKHLGHSVKIWTDRYPFYAETKGFSTFIRPKRIIITSNFLPGEIFSARIALAMVRRYRIIHIPE